MMESSKRIGIILLSSVLFVIFIVFLGISLGIPFSQTKTFLTLAGLALTFSIGTEQILRWTEDGQIDDSPEPDENWNTKRSQTVIDGCNSDNTSSSTEQSLYSSYLDDKEWLQYHDEGYESNRILFKAANQVGSLIYQIPYLTKRRVWATIAFIMFLGFAGSVVAFSEQMVQYGFETGLWRDLAATFSIELIESNPTLAVITSLSVSLLPLWYLISKQQMTCEECGTEFSLKSRGRFYNGHWGKEPVPIHNDDGDQVGKYNKYDGYRILECNKCGRQYDLETQWDDREEQL